MIKQIKFLGIALKNWTIHFNREVVLDDLSKQGIVVTDSKGNRVDVQIELGADNKSIVVEYPAWGYLLGENYQLTVNNKVHDKNNKGIKQAASLNFNVEPKNKDAVIFKDKVFQDAVNNLEKLTLDDTQISNINALKELKGLKNLKVVKLSDSERKTLQEALPNCKISRL